MNEDEIKRAKKVLENCRFGKLGDKHQENPWFPDLNENQKQRMEALEAMSFEDRDKWLNGEWNPTPGAIEGEVLRPYQKEAISKLCETRHGRLFARVDGIDLLIGDVLEISGFAPNSSVKNGMYNITAEGIRPISGSIMIDIDDAKDGLQKLADAFRKLGDDVRITFDSLGALEGNDLENPLAKFAKQMVERKNAAEPPFWANNYRKNKRGKGKR
jgi:hypothetical protein